MSSVNRVTTTAYSRRKAKRVIALMQQGATLRRAHYPNSTRWELSSGQPVSDEIARAIVARSDVVAAGDALFDRGLSQTWMSKSSNPPTTGGSQ